jgi:hypothetical protein
VRVLTAGGLTDRFELRVALDGTVVK